MSKSKILLLLAVVTLLAYGASLFYGFSQDDWFHISISHASNFKEFLNFFNPFAVSWIFFRPLSTQVPYWLATSVFSLDQAALFLHMCMLLLQIGNAYLVWRISQTQVHKKYAVLLAVFYAISNIHFLSLFYIGAIQQLLSTTFSLLAIAAILNHPKPKQWVLIIMTLAALLSKEIALRLPLLLLGFSYMRTRDIKKSLQSIIGPGLVTLAYLVLRLSANHGGASEYVVSLSPALTLATGMWYALFTLGFPELLLRYGQSHGLIDFGQFFREDPLRRIPILIGALLLVLSFGKRIGLLIKERDWRSLLLPLMAAVSLAPVLLLPTHRYPHYLDLAFLCLGIFLVQKMITLSWKTRGAALCIALGMLASISVDWQTHWTVARAILASKEEKLLLETDACHAQEGIYFTGTTQEVLDLSYALSRENGPRVICHNPKLPVYYPGITP